jgi:hypothetical protein
LLRKVELWRKYRDVNRNGLDEKYEGAVTAKVKKKAVPLQAWTGPQGSRRSRLPDF